MQQRRARRVGRVGHIGVPYAASIGMADITAIFLDIGDKHDVRLIWVGVMLQEHTVHPAQAAGEGEILVRRQRLIANTQNGALLKPPQAHQTSPHPWAPTGQRRLLLRQYKHRYSISGET